MKRIVIEKEINNVISEGSMPMVYSKEEIEDIYNDFFRGLSLELIPLKNKETIFKCMDLKKDNKEYKQDSIVTYLKLEESDENNEVDLSIDFITLFKPETLKSYGILIPECDNLDDMLFPSPYLDSNEVIDKILFNLSKELGRTVYERDKRTSGLEKFFQFLFDSEEIRIIGFEKEEKDSYEGDIKFLFSFPLIEG